MQGIKPVDQCFSMYGSQP